MCERAPDSPQRPDDGPFRQEPRPEAPPASSVRSAAQGTRTVCQRSGGWGAARSDRSLEEGSPGCRGEKTPEASLTGGSIDADALQGSSFDPGNTNPFWRHFGCRSLGSLDCSCQRRCLPMFC